MNIVYHLKSIGSYIFKFCTLKIGWICICIVFSSLLFLCACVLCMLRGGGVVMS